MIGIGLAAYGYVHQPRLPDWVRQYPQGVLALGGAVWIAFLQPQAIGWVIVVIAVVAAVRSPFTARKS
jgi:hypothetical protein